MQIKRNKLYTLFMILLVSILAISLFACKKDDPKTDTEDKGSVEEITYDYENVILMYMCGSDLETRYAAATDNINEMLDSDIPDDTLIVLETGGAKNWRDLDISNDSISRYEITNHDMQLVETLPNASMGDASTLYDFLNFGIENYSARRIGLVFWDHGGGGLGGVCFDENYNYDSLTIGEIDDVFSKVVSENDIKFDLIGFDACLMANIETADIVSKYANYMIASVEDEPLGGWNYTNFAKNFGSYDGYINIINDYENKCLASDENMYTMSLIDMAKFGEIKSSFSILTEKLNGLESIKDAGMSAHYAMSFGSTMDSFGSNYIDFVDFSVGLHVFTTIPACNKSIVTVNSQTKEDACGLSMFFPYSFDDEIIDNYISLPIDGEYKRFIEKNFTKVTDNNIVFTDLGSDKDGEVHVAITEESKKYVRDVKYKIYRFVKDSKGMDHTYLLGYDSDVITDETGYTTSFGGKWVSWNGAFIPCSMIDRVDDITIFSTPIKLNGVEGELIYAYDLGDKSFEIQGFIEKRHSLASNRIITLKPEDKVTLLYDDRTYELEETLIEGQTFVYKDAPNLEVQPFPSGYFQSYIIITDVFGIQYRTNSVVSYFDGVKMRIDTIGDNTGDD